ncbi:hypothetical protein MY5147_004851 [Beauveria neobassiana]
MKQLQDAMWYQTVWAKEGYLPDYCKLRGISAYHKTSHENILPG